MNPKVVIISGPTATGKTQCAIDLARQLPPQSAWIINFDSLLFYQELSIGTARPSLEEMQGVPHYLVGHQSIAHPLTAFSYAQLALPLIAQAHTQGVLPILVGGSGFYLQAVLTAAAANSAHATAVDPAIRERSDQLYAHSGIEPFRKLLYRQDRASFARLHPNDHYRIRRACEHIWQQQTPFEAYGNGRTRHEHPLPWPVLHLYLDLPKELHWQKIQERSAKMIQAGLEDEIATLLKTFSGTERPLQSIGQLEMVQYLRGEIATLEECQEKISLATRRLAKAQRTWFKSITEKECFNPLTDMLILSQRFQEFAR